MDLSIPRLTKLANKCGKQYLCYSTNYQGSKKCFVQDGIPYRPNTVCRAVLSHAQSYSTSSKLKEKRIKNKRF